MEALEVEKIESFHGPYRWLSNFWPAEVELDGERYRTVEHAYQAAKSADPEFRDLVRMCPRPEQAKMLGKTAPLRKGWISMKDEIMTDLLRQKFQDLDLREKLLATGNAALIEGNTWGDTYWGICRGRGQNRLGIILMRIRSELRSA